MNAARKALLQRLGELLMQGEQEKQAAESRGVKLLEPGVYENIPAEHYHALPYCSNSRLSLLKRSPAHMRADIDNPPEPTDAQKLGVAIHLAVLEWEVFAARYTMAGQCAAILKSGDRKGEQCTNGGKLRYGGEWRCGQHPIAGAGADAVDVLSLADYAACEGVRRSILAHPKLHKLLECEGRAELTVIWDDPDTGVRCKARVDRLCMDYGGIVLDLKSTTDAREDAFAKTIFERGYYRQLGLYQDALAAHGIEIRHCVFIAAEKTAPYAVAGYRLTDVAALAGRDETQKLMQEYAECQAANRWPAYPTDIKEVSLPTWAWDRVEGVAA